MVFPELEVCILWSAKGPDYYIFSAFGLEIRRQLPTSIIEAHKELQTICKQVSVSCVLRKHRFQNPVLGWTWPEGYSLLRPPTLNEEQLAWSTWTPGTYFVAKYMQMHPLSRQALPESYVIIYVSLLPQT